MSRAPQRKMSSPNIGSGPRIRLWEWGLRRGALVHRDPARSRVQPVLALAPERLRETPAASPGVWAASRDSEGGSERPHCARSAPSVPRAQRARHRERESKMHLGWGKGALTAARSLSHSANTPG